MLIYILVLLLLLLPLLFLKRQDSKNSNMYYWFEFIVLFLLMGLRYRVGGDSLRYELYYNNHPNLDQLFATPIWWLTGFQPLWTLLMALCKSFTNDFVFFQLIHSFIVNGIVFFIANKYKASRYTFTLLYYFILYPYFCTEIMRESIAVVCFMLGYIWLMNEKRILYFIMCVVAFLFHASALFLFFIPFIQPILSRLSGLKSYILLGIIAFGISYYFEVLLSTVTSALFSQNTLIEGKAEGILNSSSLNIFGILVKLFSMIPIFVAFQLNRKKQNNCYYYSERFIILLYLLVSILSIIIIPLVRLENYFSILFLIIFSKYTYEFRQSKKTIISIGVFILVLTRLSYYNSGLRDTQGKYMNFKHYQMYVPYHSVFDEETDAERERNIGIQM